MWGASRSSMHLVPPAPATPRVLPNTTTAAATRARLGARTTAPAQAAHGQSTADAHRQGSSPAGAPAGAVCEDVVAPQLRIRVPSADLSPAAEGEAHTHVAALAARLALHEGDPAVVGMVPHTGPEPGSGPGPGLEDGGQDSPGAPGAPPPPSTTAPMSLQDLCRAVRQELGCTTELPVGRSPQGPGQ